MPRLSFSRQILPAIALLAIIVAAVIVWRSQPQRALADPPRQPPAAPAGARAIVAGAGVIEPASELVEIAPEIAGVVDRVHVTVGTRVAAGDPLFSIDSRDARADLAEAEARVARLRQTVAAAQTTRNVAREQAALYRGAGADPRAFSRQEIITRDGAARDAEAQIAVARAQLDEALAARETARVTLARHTVRAPIAATVLQVRTRAGQFAATGNAATPLVSIGAVDPLHVRVDIDENEIARIETGKPAWISPKGSARRRVQVAFVRAEPLIVPKRSLTNAATERVDVRVLQLIYALPQGASAWFVGQQVDAFVPGRPAR